MVQKTVSTALSLMLLGVTAAGVHAQTTFDASANGYVDSGGYYAPAKTSSAIEVEGPSDPNDAPQYQSYGLLQFTGTPTGPIGGATNLVFNAYDDGSSYENAGQLDFYLVGNPAVNTSTLSLDPTVTGNPVGVSLSSQNALDLISIGTYNFQNNVGQDNPFDVPLSLSGAAESAFAAEAEAGDIALLYTADASTPGAGLFLDQYDSKYTVGDPAEALTFQPTPALAAVPETSPFALLGLGLLPLGLLARRRRSA